MSRLFRATCFCRWLFLFPADMSPVEVETNRLNDQTLVRYYEAETRRLER